MFYTEATVMANFSSAQRTLNLLAIQKPEITARLIRQVTGVDAVVILDLEDSLWDVADVARTAALKARGRQDLFELAKIHPEIFHRNRIGIRVNRFSSTEFSADLEVLSEMGETLPLSVIVPTKVESAQELLQCQKALHEAGVACEAVVPIVETLNGMTHLSEITSAAADTGIPAIIYGHYDYCLSAGLWPFPEFDEISYWELVEPFIAKVQSMGLGFVQPPFFSMYNDALFLGLLGELERKCKLPFGVLTFGPHQTRLCADVVGRKIQASVINLRESRSYSREEKSQRAADVIQAYESHRMENKGFAVDPRSGRFIAPHLYSAAKAYLDGFHD
jgi:citrate lyase beta subunit